MALQFRCFSCQQLLAAPADARVRIAYCPNCKAKMSVPRDAEEMPAPLPADLSRVETHLTERLARARELNNLALHLAQQAADAYPWLQLCCQWDDDTCAYCRSLHGSLLRTAGCTPAQVPPFRQCTCKKHGCRCIFIPIDRNHPSAPS
jgi:hypothetical protein